MANLIEAYGYQGDAMNLPVGDVESAASFYVETMGFRIVEQIQTPTKKTVLGRDEVRFAIAENGGDPEQDGCAFHTDDIDGLRDEFKTNGYPPGEIKTERRKDGTVFRAFFAIAPDGLCYWFGERET